MLAATRVDKDSLGAFCSLPGLSELTPEIVKRHRPESSWLLEDAGTAVARFSLWWKKAPQYASHRVGLVGHYAARDEEAARAALQLACEELSRMRCTLAVAPMDGSTWRRYRLLTLRGDEPRFFLEPDNPDEWPRHFVAQGFKALARYYSALNSDLSRSALGADRSHPVTTGGIEIRPFRPTDVAGELARIWQVASVGFKDNFLYTPIEEGEFGEIYRPVLPRVRPELVLLAERHRKVVGFCFTVPDLLQAARGEAVDTVIIKSATILPEFRGQGLGSLLVARSLDMARILGYRRAIFALMHETNVSRRIDRDRSEDFRQYVLYSREL